MPAVRFDAFRAVRSFASLDGIRCGCILAVVFHHASDGVDWLPASRRGFLGVDMFFVLSGFLIVTLLLREKSARGDVALGQFVIRRALRIFPVYYGLLAVLAIAFTLRPGAKDAADYWRGLPYFLTFTSNWTVQSGSFAILWSLATEEQFYLVWPAVQKYLTRRIIVVLLLVIIVVNQLMNFRLIDEPFRRAFGVGYDDLSILQATFTPIALGALLANFLHESPGFVAVDWLTGRRWMSGMWLLVLLALIDAPVADLGGWPRLAIQVTMTLFLAACVVREDHVLKPILSLRPARWIGSVSYGLYLYHLFAIGAAMALLSRSPVRFPGDVFWLGLAIGLLVAGLSYRYYERPFLHLKNRFTPPREGHV
ncbi:MAG: acyltransferase [Gemmataceae bacterium]